MNITALIVHGSSTLLFIVGMSIGSPLLAAVSLVVSLLLDWAIGRTGTSISSGVVLAKLQARIAARVAQLLT